MSEHSAIEWCDATWNPTTGCTKVSPGCANCYIETTTPFRVQHRTFERGHIPLKLHHGRLEQPLRWTKPKRIFVNSLSDLFHADVPDAFIDQVFAVMALCPQHTFQILTKRAERMRQYVTGLSERLGELWDLTNQPTWITLPAGRSFPRYPENWPLPNVWLGVSVENQRFAEERIPLLLQTPAAVRFISAEPLLEAIDIRKWMRCYTSEREHGSQGKVVIRERFGFDWLIVGGESGRAARRFDLRWVRSLKEQVDCSMGGTKLFIKQLGSNPRVRVSDVTAGLTIELRGKNSDVSRWPVDLQLREFPKPANTEHSCGTQAPS